MCQDAAGFGWDLGTKPTFNWKKLIAEKVPSVHLYLPYLCYLCTFVTSMGRSLYKRVCARASILSLPPPGPDSRERAAEWRVQPHSSFPFFFHLLFLRSHRVQTREIERLNGVYKRILDNAGVTLFEGKGVIVDPHTVEIQKPDGTKERLTAKYILVATGGRPTVLDIPGKVSFLSYTGVCDYRQFCMCILQYVQCNVVCTSCRWLAHRARHPWQGQLLELQEDVITVLSA